MKIDLGNKMSFKLNRMWHMHMDKILLGATGHEHRQPLDDVAWYYELCHDLELTIDKTTESIQNFSIREMMEMIDESRQ